MCVHDPSDGRGEAKTPFHQVKSKRCMRPSPMDSIYCHAWPRHVSPRSPNGARMYVHDLVGGWGVMAHTPTHAKCSHATLPHTSLPPAPYNKSWLNKQAVLADQALCLLGRKLACVLLKSKYIQVHNKIYNNNQRGARRVTVEEQKKAAARCLPLT
jgi:hypothetical protein